MAQADLMQEGLQYLLEAAFSKTQTPPVNFYLGLCTDTSLAENANLAAVHEITGTNYARIAVASSVVGFPTSATAGTLDWHTKTKDCVFTGDAANDWQGAVGAFLATSSDNSGKLIAYATLGATRTLLNGDTLTVSLDIQLNG